MDAIKQKMGSIRRALAQLPLAVMLRQQWWEKRPKWRDLMRQGDHLIVQPAVPQGARRIMIYCPESLAREHLLTMQIMARILMKAGHQVLMSHCRALFHRCVPKEALRGDAPPSAGAKICTNCMRSRLDLIDPAQFDGFALEKAITPAIREQVQCMIDALPDTALAGFTIDGFKLGVACWHDLMLSRKLMFDTPLDAENYLYLRQYLHTVAATYLAMKEFLPKASFTDVLLYGQYAANIAVVCAAEKAGVNWRLAVNINHLGVDRRRIYVNRAQSHLWISHMIDSWPAWRDVSLAADEVDETGDDVLIRFGAKSHTTYSPAKTRDSDIFSALGLDRGRRLVTAFTSSLDEYHAEDIIDDVLGFPSGAAPERPYPDQITWLKALSREIGARPELQLVIRIHPREDANKREGARSRHLELLHRNLAELPANVKVVWPADAVSSYDLIEASDVVQVWSSTVGLESARLGIPVIKILRGYESYPEGEFAISAPDHDGVIAALNRALEEKPDLDRLIKAWRFYGYSRYAASIDLRDVLPSQYEQLPPYLPPRRANEAVRAILDHIPVWTINRQSPDFSATRLGPEEESAAVKRQLRRILHAIFTGEWPPADVAVNLQPGPSPASGSPSGTLAVEGHQCSYVWDGRVHTRYSPMCARLATLAAHRVAPVASVA